MEKEIRHLKKEDTEAMFKLAGYAFNKELTVDKREQFARLVENSNNYGLFVKDQLASQVMCTPFEINFHGSVYKMGGIGYVSSYPEYRGQGKIREIMSRLLEDMKKEKMALSYLAPFSYEFYRRFGYEQVFENLSYRFTPDHLPKIKETSGYVKRMKLKYVQEYLKQLYEKDEKNHKGGVIREDWWWHYLLFKNKNYDYAVYFDDTDTPQGYLIYERKDQVFTVIEWNYLTFEAFRGLGKFITSHKNAFSELIYVGPNTEHSLEFLVQEPEGQVKVEPYMMARIVDLSLFLKDYPYLEVKGNRDFYLEVKDDFAHWNQGIWHLVIQEKKITVEKIDGKLTNFNKDTLLTGDIQSWTQLFMGYRRPTTLAFYQRIKGNQQVLNKLEESIPRGLPSLVDYF